MITIAQCSDNDAWDVTDRLTFQIYNGNTTTYIRIDDPTVIRSLGMKDFNIYKPERYPFYYKEKK